MEPQPQAVASHRRNQRAMRLSLAAAVLMLAGKLAAWWFTGSSAIFADAAESVIHLVAVAFASFSLALSTRPPSKHYLFGFERISFFSAGFEGALIMLAAVTIIVSAVRKWITGFELDHLGLGTLAIVAAAAGNLWLGLYLLRTGKRTGSIILEANGRHVLTDSWTSFGVVAGLGLVLITGWKPLDPIAAIAVAVNILWSGGRLLWRSASGLLDYADPETGRRLREHLDTACQEIGVAYHGVRFRFTGQRVLVQVHLLFPFETPVGEAHRAATRLEDSLEALPGLRVELETHLEALEDHGHVHGREHYTGRPS